MHRIIPPAFRMTDTPSPALKILLVEDDRRLASDLALVLGRHGWSTTSALGIGAAMAALTTATFDVVLLDLSLPDGSGFDLLAGLRAGHPQPGVPVIVISAQADLASRLAGFDKGADDYIAKPFSFEELEARITAVRRRVQFSSSARLTIADIDIEPATAIVTVRGAPAGFTPREAALLAVLVRNAGRVVARNVLSETINDSSQQSENAIEVLVHRVRRRLGDAGAGVSVHTIKGIGYLLTVTT